MSRFLLVGLLSCVVLAGCEKPPLLYKPGEAPAVILDADNQAPKVNAGPDATVQWPVDSIDLDGAATDDGLPADSKLQYTWTASADGVSFDNPMQGRAKARFAAPGTYVLALMVSDGALRTSDSVTVTVLPAARPNAAPQVNAGPDQSSELPFDVTLQATASDDGQPSDALTYQWTMRTGPAAVAFTNAAGLNTEASFTQPGIYELLLTASDGDKQSSDSVIVSIAAATYPGTDTDENDPNGGWPRVPPADIGVDESLLEEAAEYAKRAGGAGMIVHRGRLVYSWGNIDQRFDVKSTTKSIGGIALAFALAENKVRIEDRAATHLSTIGTPPNTNDPQWLSEITLAQLATHTAGFEKTGGYGDLLARPGTHWHYSDGGLNWLADVLTTVYAQDLHVLLQERVWKPLGMNANSPNPNLGDDARWRPASSGFRKDPRPNGIEHREFASGMYINANAMARVGLLHLRRGEWAGNQRIFPASFVDLVRTPRAETAATVLDEALEYPDANRRYGVLWWTNATGALPDVPRDAYWAWGMGDSLIVVIPSLDLVISRAGDLQPPTPTSRIFGDDDWTGEYTVLQPFLNPIVAAFEAVR